MIRCTIIVATFRYMLATRPRPRQSASLHAPLNNKFFLAFHLHPNLTSTPPTTTPYLFFILALHLEASY